VTIAATLVAFAMGTRRYIAVRRAWTDDRLALTHDLVEAMAGHATRLVQQRATDRHAAEDEQLARYTRRSEALDRRLVWLQATVPRGWLVLATAGLTPALFAASSNVAAIAIALGGMLLGYQALTRLGDAAVRLVDAATAWRSLSPLVAAGGNATAVGPPSLVHSVPSPGRPLAVARGIVYSSSRSAVPVLAGCDLEIRDGDRVLLEGTSGAGKSTLAHVLAGLRAPDAGLVLAGGLDKSTLGEHGWRRRIVLAPQFHDNHVFTGPLAFNVLMGRTWPASHDDLKDADELLRELGLGPTIDRMPGGMFQMLGETGWQLSHGERSRLFVARALLSRAPVVVLDESLAALDPETLVEVVACIERRARAAVIIAHP
jgi:ATP-binding cassette subfamily B protein